MKYIINTKLIRYTMFLVVILVSLSACDEFLEEVPTEDLTTSADLSDRQFGEAFTMGAYRQLSNWTGGARDWGNILPNTLEFPTGGAYTVEPHAQFDKYSTNQVTGDLLDNFNNQWTNWYRGVQDCNLALEQLPQVVLSESEFNQLDAEVRTLRAFYYFCIVRYWGDAILLTESVTDVFASEMPKTSLKTIYDDLIIPELEGAISKLPAGASSNGRVTENVARAILADVYMTVAGYPYQEVATDPAKDWCGTGSWAAQTYPVASGKDFLIKAKAQLDMLYGQYSLGTYDDLHDPAMNNMGEAIFQVQYDKELGTNGVLQPSLPLLTAISKSDENGSFTPWVGYTGSYAVGDKRAEERQFFFTYDYHIDDPSLMITFDRHLYKYYVEDAVKTTFGSGLNWSHYRYGEILLSLTEVNWALKQLGDPIADADIVKGINEIRIRAELLPIDAAALTLKDILSERAWELIFENKMLWDQRRTRKCLVYGENEISAIEDYIGHSPELFNYSFAPQHLLSPIPGNEMARNDEMAQNSGYLPN